VLTKKRGENTVKIQTPSENRLAPIQISTKAMGGKGIKREKKGGREAAFATSQRECRGQ